MTSNKLTLLAGLPAHRLRLEYSAATGAHAWRCTDCGGAQGPPVYADEAEARAAHDERALRAWGRWIEVDGRGRWWRLLDAPIGIDERPRLVRQGVARNREDAVEAAKAALARLQELEAKCERRDITVVTVAHTAGGAS